MNARGEDIATRSRRIKSSTRKIPSISVNRYYRYIFLASWMVKGVKKVEPDK
jgi:hypothetical protein